MIGAFKFNGIESSSFDLVCKSIKRPLLPAVKVKRVDIPGSSGVYDFPYNEYAMRPLTMRITYMGDDFEELRSRARDIAAWLSTDDWAQLIIHDDPDKYYLAKITALTEFSSVQEAGEADLLFDCQPFAYATTESVYNFTTGLVDYADLVFSNSGTRVINYKSPYGSKFLITVVGSWTTLSLTLNGQVLSYTEAVSSKTLVIDNIEMEAELDSVNVFDKLDGDIDTFLSIIQGSNTLTLNGTGLNLTSITVNFIPLWM